MQRLGAGRSEAAEALCGHLIKQMATGTQHSQGIAGELRSRHDRQIRKAGWMGLHFKYLMHARYLHDIWRLDRPGSGAYVICRLRAHAGGLLQRLTRDFPGLRWSLPAMTSLYMGASGNLDPDTGADADGDSGGSALVYQFLAQVCFLTSICTSSYCCI